MSGNGKGVRRECSHASLSSSRLMRDMMREGATLPLSSQETQLGLSHKASEARLRAKQGRQQGHRGSWLCTNLQMVTEGPISCCPITKKVLFSLLPPPPNSFLLVPPPSLPPSSQEKERKQKVLGLHHCLHHCDNLHIYLVIFSLFFWSLLQSISPDLVCAAETCRAEQVVILEITFFLSVLFLLGGKTCELRCGTSLNQVFFFF